MNKYFPHDCNARSDERIIALRIQHGWTGYGLYFALIEKLCDSVCYSLKADYNLLAYDLRSDASLIKSVICDFGLFAFTEDGECFYSESLNRRMEPLDAKSKRAQEAAKKRWGNKSSSEGSSKESVDREDTNAMQMHESSDAKDDFSEFSPLDISGKTVQKEEKNANAMQMHKKSDAKDAVLHTKIDADKIREDNIRQDNNIIPLTGDVPKSKISIDFQALVDLFNAKFEGKLSRVTQITDKRKAAIRARIANHGKESVVKVFDLVLNSPFLLGENNRNWRADFDWIFKPSNFVKILEGNYLKRESNGTCKQNRDTSRKSELAGYFREAFAGCDEGDQPIR